VYMGGAVAGLGTVYAGEGETAVTEITQEEAVTIPPWPEPYTIYLPLIVKP
jgi:hypothetical protein